MTTTAVPLRLVLAAVLLAALLAACTADSGGPGWTFATLGPTPQPTVEPSPSGSAPPAGNVIELAATASLRFAQNGQPIDQLELAIGEDYTFRVDNTAGFTHNIYLGPPDRLAANDVAGLPGIPDWESGVMEFTWTATADAAGWEFGCTVVGHYQGGMRGTLVLGEGQ